MKVYVLTSRNIERLNWIEQVIPQRETVVVINSLDLNYGAVASKWCEERGYEYHITESDGTPATGKNSVIKLFLESEEEYMVAVDGDDILTPHGYKLYKAVAESNNAPDCICLYRHAQVKQPDTSSTFNHEKLFRCIEENLLETDETWKQYWSLEYPADKSGMSDWETPENLYNVFRCAPWNAEPDLAWEWADERALFNHYIQNFSDVEESFLRMVFFSRKCAELVDYDNELTIGEDTHQWMKLKKLSQDGLIDMQRRKERYNPSYMSVREVDSIMLTVGLNNYDWLRPFNNKIMSLRQNGSLPERFTALKEFNDGTYL